MSDLIPWLQPWSGRVIVGVVVLLGLALMLWGLRRRPSNTPRCRKCRYELTGLASLKCPECGWVAQQASDAMRGPRRWWFVVIGLALALALPGYVFIKRTKQFGWEYYLTFGPGHYFFGTQTLDSITFNGASLRITRDRSPDVWENTVEITSAQGTQALTSRMWEFGYTMSDGTTIGRGDDITGNSKPNLVLMEFTGGAHCCFIYHIYESDAPRELHEIATIDAQHGGGFEDRDGDGVPEFITHDWTWAYALTCFACLRYPDVVLMWDGLNYVPAFELMRGPEPTEGNGEFARRIYREEQSQGFIAVDQLYSEMLERIYTGYAATAWELFQVAWQPTYGDKSAAREEFLNTLYSSPYISTLRELNSGTLDPPPQPD